MDVGVLVAPGGVVFVGCGVLVRVDVLAGSVEVDVGW
jgi:hypothetical protein